MQKTHRGGSTQTTARDFFIYLAFLITLVWLIVALIGLCFGLIEFLIPDALSDFGYSAYASGITSSMASLIIVAPFFVLIGSRINRDLRNDPGKKTMWVRKWLLYAILFLAFIVALTDLVVLVRSFLMGEITNRFIWKTIVVLLVSGVSFSYFLFELRRDPTSASKIPLYSSLGLGVALVALIVAGFMLAGSPVKQRELRLDMQRVNDLSDLRWQIDAAALERGSLLGTLEEYDFSYTPNLVDPVTGEEYGYRVIDEDTYELCATFMRESDRRFSGHYGYPNDDFEHGSGEECFEFTLTPTPEAGL